MTHEHQLVCRSSESVLTNNGLQDEDEGDSSQSADESNDRKQRKKSSSKEKLGPKQPFVSSDSVMLGGKNLIGMLHL